MQFSQSSWLLQSRFVDLEMLHHLVPACLAKPTKPPPPVSLKVRAALMVERAMLMIERARDVLHHLLAGGLL